MSTSPAFLQWSWQPQPQAEIWIHQLVQGFCADLPAAARLADRIHARTGTRFVDWIDTLSIPAGAALETRLRALDFVEHDADPRPFERAWIHPGGRFPRIVQGAHAPLQLWLACEDVADFCARHADDPELAPSAIEGAPLSPLRKARVAGNHEAELWVVERAGNNGFAAAPADAHRALAAAEILESFRCRRRHHASDQAGFDHAQALIDAAIARIGVDHACALFFRAERELWQRRNHAAQAQKARQDQLGLGWANGDHHTYRSSRAGFANLIAVLEKLGFQPRECFYAGREAGWGAQVLYQPRAGVVVFADVDLSPDELLGGFPHAPLAERANLGTIGLWCALHGEAFLQAGLHHLACHADFTALRDQLQHEAGVAQMPPFTELPHLKQAFTAGERWPVDPARIDALAHAGRITTSEARAFREDGAIGSHLENIERNGGFQGFNQAGISEIITATDPRAQR